MIRLDTYKRDCDDMEPGETRRLNHTDCPAGEDTRRRLYLTRPHADPNIIVGYCHNCQDGGRWSTDKYSKYRNDQHGVMPVNVVVTDEVKPPVGMEYQLHLWPTDAIAWVYKNKLTQEMLTYGDIAYDPSSNRVYLPRYNYLPDGHELMGYQLRKVTKGRGPKYLTVSREEDKGFTRIMSGSYTHHTAGILVEDLVSGIHLAYALGGTPTMIVVNYGVKINLYALDAMKNLETILVWLDNDSQHVINQAKQMQGTLALISAGQVDVVDEYSDPKHYSKEEIRGILNGHY